MTPFNRIKLLLVAAIVPVTALADGPSGSGDSTDDTAAQESKPKMVSLVPRLEDYSGDLWSRKYMTGDWGGARTKLAEDGISFKLNLTQVFQGNARGGTSTNGAWSYSGSADLYIEFDTARMGWWPGGLLTLHGETQFGQGLDEVGSIMPPNFDAIITGNPSARSRTMPR